LAWRLNECKGALGDTPGSGTTETGSRGHFFIISFFIRKLELGRGHLLKDPSE
jgi:hypothetical protein